MGVFDLNVLEAGISEAAYNPLTGDDKDAARHYAQKNRCEQAEKDRVAKGFEFDRARNLMRDFEALRAMPENMVEQIEAKAGRLRALSAQGASAWQLETACDLYVSAFLLPKRKGGAHAGPDGMPRRGAETVPTSGTIWEWLRGVQPFAPLFGAAIDTARNARAFHWPLEFPDVMHRGGFDVVLGNPPWEVMQLEQIEYFAARMPNIATLHGAERKKAVAALERENPDMFVQYEREKRLFDAAREYARECGRFPLAARGKVNTYAVFAELSRSLCDATSGRFGLIVPTGIATDATTADFFASMIKSRELVMLADFENRNGIFPAVHRTYRFSLLVGGHKSTETKLFFFLDDVTQLQDPERLSLLSVDDIECINPNTGTAPVFRTCTDAEIVKKIHRRVPIFVSDANRQEGNPWGAEFRQGLFDMFYDSGFFMTGKQLKDEGYIRNGQEWILPPGAQTPARVVEVRGKNIIVKSKKYLPLFEAKMFDLYNHRFADYRSRGDERGHRVLPGLTTDELADPDCEIEPYYWVPDTTLKERVEPRSFLIGYGEATTAITERTCIVTIMPFAGIGHKQILIFTGRTPSDEVCLVANCNSIVLDYVARTKVSYINFGRFIFKQLPLFPPDFYTVRRKDFLLERVLELTYTSGSMAPFARDLGRDGPPFAWDVDRRAHLRADLDAFYARAYGLTRDELRYILDPADVKGADYPSETFRVLKEEEIRHFGEYRTRRLVLEAWDRMEANGTFVDLGLGVGSVVHTAPTIQKSALAALPDGAHDL